MANMKRTNPDVITVGSAIAYLMEYAGTVPEVEEICVEKNHLGWIKSGATIEYTQSSATYKDDLGRKSPRTGRPSRSGSSRGTAARSTSSRPPHA